MYGSIPYRRSSEDEITPLRFGREMHSLSDAVELMTRFGPLERTLEGDRFSATYGGDLVFRAERIDPLTIQAYGKGPFKDLMKAYGYEPMFSRTPLLENETRTDDADDEHPPMI